MPAPSQDTDTIYHIAARADWQQAQAGGLYAGSVLCRAHGFIHFSAADQLGPTLARFFAGRADLVLLAAEVPGLSDALAWETGPDGVFPHYYGVLPVAMLHEVGEIGLDADGSHRIPAGLVL
jgi:uncharacterized protein (DUF952 family)